MRLHMHLLDQAAAELPPAVVPAPAELVREPPVPPDLLPLIDAVMPIRPRHLPDAPPPGAMERYVELAPHVPPWARKGAGTRQRRRRRRERR